VGRPNTMDDYNDQLFKLAKFYNAQIGFENNRGSVIPYAKQHKLLDSLCPQPTLGRNNASDKEPTSWGITMTEPLKDMGEIYLRDWLNMPISMGHDGEQIKVLHTILDIGLLSELIRFNRKKGNFDRVMALLVGMFFLEEKRHQEVAPKGDSTDRHGDFFNRDLF
jgi:hypothetical protein